MQQLLETFDLVNINISALGLPLQCFGLRGYEDYLAVTIFASHYVERSLFTQHVPQLLCRVGAPGPTDRVIVANAHIANAHM